jgi:hypothetical protein
MFFTSKSDNSFELTPVFNDDLNWGCMSSRFNALIARSDNRTIADFPNAPDLLHRSMHTPLITTVFLAIEPTDI